MLRVCTLVDNTEELRIEWRIEWKKHSRSRSFIRNIKTNFYCCCPSFAISIVYSERQRQIERERERQRADGFLRLHPNTSPADDDADGNRICAWRLEINNENSICFCQKLILTDLHLGSWRNWFKLCLTIYVSHTPRVTKQHGEGACFPHLRLCNIKI